MDSIIVQLPLSVIEEDPNQPRTEFDMEALQELAATIRLRGVKTPISVRHASQEGRYVVNHGARRLRACRLLNLETIPACIDDDYTEADQLIENLQRENLKPREIARFLSRLREKGMKQGEIAKAVGKSIAWVSQHLALLSLPPPVATVFNDGRCQDVTVICELVRLQKKYPEQTETWLDDSREINRTTLKSLQSFVATLRPEKTRRTEEQEKCVPSPVAQAQEKKLRHPVVRVYVDGTEATLLLDRWPSAPGRGWFLKEGQPPFEATLDQVRLIEITGD